jgi:epoxide hydrolase-like predicted phosphatase
MANSSTNEDLTMVKSVVFDFGGVIITPITRTIGSIADGLGCSATDLHHILMGPQFESGDHPWHRLERGEIEQAQLQNLLTPIAAEQGVEFRGNEIQLLLQENAFDINHYVLDHIGSLRERGYKTALLSNSIKEFSAMLKQIVPPELFDAYIDSSQVGMRKPESRIFRHTLDQLGVSEASHAVFLDDFAGNLAGAQAVGMRTIHVVNPRVALDELESLLGS